MGEFPPVKSVSPMSLSLLPYDFLSRRRKGSHYVRSDLRSSGPRIRDETELDRNSGSVQLKRVEATKISDLLFQSYNGSRELENTRYSDILKPLPFFHQYVGIYFGELHVTYVIKN